MKPRCSSPVIAPPLLQHPLGSAEAHPPGEDRGSAHAATHHEVYRRGVPQRIEDAERCVPPQLAQVLARAKLPILLRRIMAALLDEDDLLTRLGQDRTRHRAGRPGADHHHVGLGVQISREIAPLDDRPAHRGTF